MKTKELSKQVRDKGVEKYRLGLGYKKYLKPWTSHGVPLNPLLKPGKNTINLPREGLVQAMRALIREATKRRKITLKELQSSTAKIGVSVHRTSLSRTLHRAVLHGRVAREK